MSTKVLRVQPSNGDSNVTKVQISPRIPYNDVCVYSLKFKFFLIIQT